MMAITGQHLMRVVVVPFTKQRAARAALSYLHTRGVSSYSCPALSYQCVVIGGGTGGCAMASKMSRKLGKGKVAVIKPAQTHYNQALWTMVGGGYKSFAQSGIDMYKAIPRGADWIRDSVLSVEPEQNLVITASGQKYVQKTYKALQNFKKGGTAIFTMPPMPIKCPGSPQKIMYLFDDRLRKTGRRDGTRILFNTSLPFIFAVKKYADVLLELAAERGIDVSFEHKLVEVDYYRSEATFARPGSSAGTVTMKYDLLHIAPPMKAHDFLQDSPISNEAGFVVVDKDYLQSTKYNNVFALASESGVLEKSIEAFLKGDKPSMYKYDGYTSCPIPTQEGRTILAEFDYNLEPLETFPVNQGKERWTMWFMKKNIITYIYWKMLIRVNYSIFKSGQVSNESVFENGQNITRLLQISKAWGQFGDNLVLFACLLLLEDDGMVPEYSERSCILDSESNIVHMEFFSEPP